MRAAGSAFAADRRPADGAPLSTSPRGPGCPSLEQLAALVDGRLEGGEHARVLAHLGTCPACYEVFLGTVEVVEELELGGEVVAHPAVRPAGAGRWAGLGALAAAAMLGLVVWTPLLDRIGAGGGEQALAAARLGGALVAGGSAGAPYDRSGWSVTRGPGAFSAGLGERQRSFRAGVRAVDLEVALRAGRPQAALQVLPELEDLAASFDLSEPLVVSYRYLAEQLEGGTAPARLATLSGRTADELALAGDREYFAFGAWAEAGRLAAEAGDRRYFRRPGLVEATRRLAALDLPERVAAPVGAALAMLEAGPGQDQLPLLRQVFGELVREGANL